MYKKMGDIINIDNTHKIKNIKNEMFQKYLFMLMRFENSGTSTLKRGGQIIADINCGNINAKTKKSVFGPIPIIPNICHWKNIEVNILTDANIAINIFLFIILLCIIFNIGTLFPNLIQFYLFLI